MLRLLVLHQGVDQRLHLQLLDAVGLLLLLLLLLRHRHLCLEPGQEPWPRQARCPTETWSSASRCRLSPWTTCYFLFCPKWKLGKCPTQQESGSFHT